MTYEEILKMLISMIKEVEPELESSSISEQDSLRDFGLDSMQRVEILMLTMSHLDVDVPRTALAKAECIGDLVKIFHSHIESGD